MAGHAFSGLAALAALAFLALALSACAGSTPHTETAAHAPTYKGNGVPEFHEAHIGSDALRERLPTE